MKKQDIIGIDAGGTFIKAGLVRNNKVITSKKIPVKNRGLYLMQDIIDLIKNLRAPSVKAVGIALPGNIDPVKGILYYCHHYPKCPPNLPIAKILKTTFKLPVSVAHDVDCFGLNEAVSEKGKQHSIVVGLTIGTGVGFALLVNKKIYRGSQNLIEVGHTIIQKDGRKCPCGGYGHLESYVSGKAMVALYQEKTGQKKTTYEIVASAKSGQRAAKFLLDMMSDYLAVGLANIIYSYSPDIIVVGGGLSVVPGLLGPARQKVKKLLFYPEQLKTKIVKSSTPYQSNILGAALITNKKKYG